MHKNQEVAGLSSYMITCGIKVCFIWL